MTTKPPFRIALFAVLAALLLMVVPHAFAGKPGSGGGGGSISLAPLVYDANANALPNLGDIVTFNISTTATNQPHVNLLCYQGGVVVYNSWRGYFAGSLDSNWNFVLGSGAWTSGAGDCTAWLGMYTRRGFQRLASTSFHVDA